jgi:hypothetical protein
VLWLFDKRRLADVGVRGALIWAGHKTRAGMLELPDNTSSAQGTQVTWIARSSGSLQSMEADAGHRVPRAA